jgi:hypothetical protein
MVTVAWCLDKCFVFLRFIYMYSYYQFVVCAVDFKIFRSMHLLDQHMRFVVSVKCTVVENFTTNHNNNNFTLYK